MKKNWMTIPVSMLVVGLSGCLTRPENQGRYRSADPGLYRGAAEPNNAPWTNPRGPSPLEEIAEREGQLRKAEDKVESLEKQLEELTGIVEGLRGDNARLTLSADALSKEREVISKELDQQGSRERDLFGERRSLMSELLAEKIRRLRVERQLVLQEIAKAEALGEG